MYEREVPGVPTVARHRACVAPTRYRTEALGRLKSPLRRSMIRFIAPLTRPARFRRWALIGATPTLVRLKIAVVVLNQNVGVVRRAVAKRGSPVLDSGWTAN
jgi:hypothetical protein